MSNMSTPVMKPSVKQQRKIKPLPDSITGMTSVDSHHLVMSEELDPHCKSKTYGKSLHVVSRVKGIGQNDKEIVLDQLTTDQVRLFARNIGVPNLGLKNNSNYQILTIHSKLSSLIVSCSFTKDYLFWGQCHILMTVYTSVSLHQKLFVDAKVVKTSNGTY